MVANPSVETEHLPVLETLDELVVLLGDRRDLYVRWSAGPAADASGRSRDSLTGVELPGLSANPLAVERWWADRSPRIWVARRLYDYQHLERRGGTGAKPWVLAGRECGRGPDNEPLVDEVEPLAWLAPDAARRARQIIEDLDANWGSLERP